MKIKTQIPLLAVLVLLFAATLPAQAQYLEITGTTVDGQLYRGYVSPDSIELDLSNKQLTSITLPDGMTGLQTLNLSSNLLAKLTLPEGLNNLELLNLSGNPTFVQIIYPKNSREIWPEGCVHIYGTVVVPDGLYRGFSLIVFPKTSIEDIWDILNSFEDLSNLRSGSLLLHAFDADYDQTELAIPEGLRDLDFLTIYSNRPVSLMLPEDQTRLDNLILHALIPLDPLKQTLDGWTSVDPLTLIDVNYPDGWTFLPIKGTMRLIEESNSSFLFHWEFRSSESSLYLDQENLTSLSLPGGMTNLVQLYIDDNELTELSIPAGMTRLRHLDVSDNELTSLTLPNDLSSLKQLNLSDNQLTSLTLPVGLSNLEVLDLEGNPIEQLRIPIGMDINNLWINGFFERFKGEIILYTPVSLSIQLGDDGGLVVVFREGVLQVAESLSGEWEDVSNAVSPFSINPAEASKKFFRVRPAEE